MQIVQTTLDLRLVAGLQVIQTLQTQSQLSYTVFLHNDWPLDALTHPYGPFSRRAHTRLSHLVFPHNASLLGARIHPHGRCNIRCFC